MEAKIKVKEIAEFILTYTPEEFTTYNGNLFTGKAGVALFLYYYNREFKCERALIKAHELLTEAVDDINSVQDAKFDPTFCQGISGILWTIDHLISQGFIDAGNGEILDYFDAYLSNAMNLMIEVNNLDFLHGSIGTGIYLLNRTHKEGVISGLSRAIEQLNNKKLHHSTGFYWKHKIGNFQDHEACNLSLSHGMAGLLIFLNKASKKDINKNLSYKLLQEGIDFILNQELKDAHRLSVFPSYALASDKNMLAATASRLGWCYGDLGVGFLLNQTGEITSNDILKDKATSLFEFNSQRRDVKSNFIIDSGICHGSAGIALIFRRLYLESGNSLYKETSEYWLSKTLAMAKHKDGYCGYIADEHHPAPGLLEGVAGIGLALLSFLTDEKPHWDELLLLS